MATKKRKVEVVEVVEAPTPEQGVDTGWGLQAPLGSKAVWGARAIDCGELGFQLLHDRQASEGEEAALAALHSSLEEGAIKRAQKMWGALSRSGGVSRRVSRRVVLEDTASVRIEADTRASFGYVYIVAYIPPLK